MGNTGITEVIHGNEHMQKHKYQPNIFYIYILYFIYIP
jgi:hypothetical protein